ncbi:MAG: hypothetical protein ABIZ71_04990 [Gemmatimonadales bacterium]
MMAMTRWGPWAAGTALVLPLLLGVDLAFGRSNVATLSAGQPGPATDRSVIGASLDSLAGAAIRVAPFRADGRQSSVAYDPARAEAPASGYTPPKPGLVLSGLIGGKAPMAVLEGIPGHDGPALLGVGDTLAGLRVRRIGEGQVTVTGMDTTWVLALRGLP